MEVNSNIKVYFVVVAIAIVLCRFLAESAAYFLWPADFENVVKLYFGNLKHMKNPRHLLLTVSSMLPGTSTIKQDTTFGMTSIFNCIDKIRNKIR